jgi:hypothetical protein
MAAVPRHWNTPIGGSSGNGQVMQLVVLEKRQNLVAPLFGKDKPIVCFDMPNKLILVSGQSEKIGLFEQELQWLPVYRAAIAAREILFTVHTIATRILTQVDVIILHQFVPEADY